MDSRPVAVDGVAKQRLAGVPGLLSYEDVMGILSCSRPTVKRLVQKGKIPAPHPIEGVGSRWFEDEIYAYLYKLRAECQAERAKRDKES